MHHDDRCFQINIMLLLILPSSIAAGK